MINFNDITNKNKTRHIPDWPCIQDHPWRRFIIENPGLEKKQMHSLI